ncbi:TorF family putative porin [Holophaga foetida]|uniref:TorF family putative porin n=1 Tax=Holophaga foetida TaxID=35839 RepID=UPI0002472166|nr:TorF family putative porin [Holophaga foetida]
MNLKPLLLVGTLSTMGNLAHAEDTKPASPHTLTGNFSLTTDYTFRGLTQNDGKPALQGGYDYAHSCGFYAGFWGSNVSWVEDGGVGSNSLETDFYLGYKFSPVKDVTVDIGAVEYYYPGTYEGSVKPHTTEAYLGLSYKWVTLKYSHAISNDWFAFEDFKNTKYYECNASLPLPQGLTLGLHAGRQDFASEHNDLDYNDYKVALTKEIVPTFTLGLAYTYASNKDSYVSVVDGDSLGGSRVALTLTKAF